MRFRLDVFDVLRLFVLFCLLATVSLAKNAEVGEIVCFGRGLAALRLDRCERLYVHNGQNVAFGFKSAAFSVFANRDQVSEVCNIHIVSIPNAVPLRHRHVILRLLLAHFHLMDTYAFNQVS